MSVSPIKHFQDMYEISNNKLLIRNKKNNNYKELFVCNGYLYIFPINYLKNIKTSMPQIQYHLSLNPVLNQ